MALSDANLWSEPHNDGGGYLESFAAGLGATAAQTGQTILDEPPAAAVMNGEN
ncbi:MAG: hypothetical protein M3295_00615 [Chloroflexota bacterium]|nr:hypothetical protein [Chloroflexota bacterium]